MRLIDADELKMELSTMGVIEIYGTQVLMAIDSCKTIDPVKHGKWIWDDEGYHCSECWHHAYGNTLEVMSGEYLYCPNCGAMMKLGEQDG